MDVQEMRSLLKRQTIYDIPMRVTFYARVSSDTDEQLNSLDNQVSYYENYIKSNSAWEYVQGYVDEGISAISTKKRVNFNRMMQDAKDGLFDFIITKEISRFARNTIDSLQCTRELLGNGVFVFFQNDGINTADEDSELRLTIMSSLAQDELRKLSSRVKFGHQQAIKSGVVLGNSNIFGYKKQNKRLVIDETQAPMIVELFEKYATDEYSLKQLENIFYDKGFRNSLGKKIAHGTLSCIISNPKYKGYYVGNKVKVVDMFTKKQKFLPPEDWVMYKDETGEIVPAIVSEELWDKANVILKRRSDDVKSRQGICNHPNLLTGKLFCTHCGTPYYRRDSKDKSSNADSIWICSGKKNNGFATCPSFAVYENDLKPLLIEVFNETKIDTEALLNEYIAYYKSLRTPAETQKELEAEHNKIELAKSKRDNLLGLLVEGTLSKAEFTEMMNKCRADIADAEAAIEDLNNELQTFEDYNEHIKNLQSVLNDARRDIANGIITKDFVNRYIDKIYITSVDATTCRLQIKIFTGKTSEKSMQKHARRVGITPKKMIENAENSMK